MPNVKVNVGEETHEVDLASIELPEDHKILAPGEVPDGFYTKDTLNASVDASWKKKFEKLKSDPLEARAVLQAHGIEVDEEGNIVRPEPEPGEDVDLDAERGKIRKAYERDHVQPLQERLEQAEERAQRLLGSRKRAEILQAAQQADVREEWLKSPVEGGRPPILDLVGSSIDYDPDHDMFAIKEGDDFAPATKEGSPWAGVSDLFDRLRKNESYEHIFKDRRANSSDYQRGKEGKKPSVSDKDWGEMTTDERVEYLRAKRAA